MLAANHVATSTSCIGRPRHERDRFVRFLTRHDVWNTPVAAGDGGMRHMPVDREAPAAAYLPARRLLREGEVVASSPRPASATPTRSAR